MILLYAFGKTARDDTPPCPASFFYLTLLGLINLVRPSSFPFERRRICTAPLDINS